MKHACSSAQNGSAFFVILLAIAIFAMLSYAVFQGGRSSSASLTKEQSKLAAQEILSYTETVRKAVQSLRLRGCTESQLSFETTSTVLYHNGAAPTDESCHVFSLRGGKASYRPMQLTWITNTNPDWWFNAQTPVHRIGTVAPELMIWSTPLKPEICSAINKLLIGKEPASESVGVHTVAFTGAYNAIADNLGDDAGSIYAGQSTGCMLRSGNSIFYAVLLAR